jgi:uncharacterized protein YdhG (YjbR/CyaY superfamily)
MKDGWATPVATGTVEEYLASLPRDQQAGLRRLKRLVDVSAPGAVWKISYRIPICWFDRRMLVGFAAFRGHSSFMLLSTGVVTAHAAKLEGFEASGGTVRFAIDGSLPVTLVRTLVKARIAENAARGRTARTPARAKKR